MPSILTSGTTGARCPPLRAPRYDLSRLEPAHAGYFKANLKPFDNSLQPWFKAIAASRSHPGLPSP